MDTVRHSPLTPNVLIGGLVTRLGLQSLVAHGGTVADKSGVLKVPIWELGLAVSTAGEPMLDAYRVADMHNAISEQFPHVERQVQVERLEPFDLIGTEVQSGPQIRFAQMTGIPTPRWWLISPNRERLVQLQDDFFALNWRRLVMPPEPAPPYPGYDAMKSQFFENLEKLSRWRDSVGLGAVKPKVAELLYDNLILLKGVDGADLKISDVLSRPGTGRGVAIAGYNANWLERVANYTEGEAQLKVSIVVGGAAAAPGEPTKKVVRLTMNARVAADSWEATGRFFDAAHGYIHECFAGLTTETIRATWDMS